MTEPAQILCCTVSARPLSEICGDAAVTGDLLAAIPPGAGGSLSRFYLRDNVPDDQIAPEGEGGTLWTRIVSGAAVAECVSGPDGRAPLPLRDCATRITPDPDERAILAGRNTLLGHCNGETTEVLRDWLLWHRRHHGADGALILERGPAQAAARRAAELKDLLAQSASAVHDLAGMIILIVDFDHPLGHSEQAHEAHPINAPDAPGKDRMTPPAPDPWHAPLAYRLAFDLLGRRFLMQARAVLNIELMDLVAAPAAGDPSVFDLACTASMGAVTLRGKQVYPWALRKDAEPGFGDHICERFDREAREYRWCLAPGRLPEGAIWMMTRILGVKPPVSGPGFWRFMALRHGRAGGPKIGQIVPKTALVESDALLAISAGLGANPLRQPRDLATPAPAAAPGPRGDRTVIVTTMKNEGPFILEWIAYHRAIGVADFLIYTNDCTDGTDDFLRLLERKGLCQWRDNPYRSVDMKPQHAALDAANSEPLVTGADWAICMDVDEYIAVHTGDGTLRALFNAVPDANMISLTWRLFGNSDIDGFRDGFITQQFTRCARAFANKPHQAWGFKTLYRNAGLFRKLGVHRPKGLMPGGVDRINWVNGSGKPMPRDQWRNAWRSHSGTYGYDLVSLNHYAVRSAESFLVKRDRGRVNHVDRDQGMAYWFRMNHNVVEDRRMSAVLPILQAEYDRLIADPEIRAAHGACVSAHAAKIAELKAQPKYQAFHAELTGAKMCKLSRLHGHFGSNVYLAGPAVIPDEIIAREPDDEFFFTVAEVDETQH
ncbi:MAG: glycosyltransferase family 2 protein [Paracoccus sp. (in: a-proteobacteria)]|nr:glycosyltransferase family 2 protein [Paracoccus sp. (in: a-proteobacteria)]